jgi:hypothetical protein
MTIVYSQVINQPNPVSGTVKEVSRVVIDKVKTKTPLYGKLIVLGQRLPENPYTLTVTRRSHPWCAVKRASKVGGVYQPPVTIYQQYTEWAPTVIQTGGEPCSMASLEGKALTRLFDKAKFYKTNVGLMVAEGRKTLNLIASTAVRLASFYSNLRAFRFRAALRNIGLESTRLVRKLARMSRNYRSGSKFAAKAFLEFSYGWVPLLSDVYSSAEDLAKSNSSRSDDVTIRGAASDTGTFSYRVDPSFLEASDPKDKGNLTVSSDGVNTVKRYVSYKLQLRVADQSKRTNANLGLVNPLTLAWELLPFSFVVDWFAPVGDYLESLSAFTGLQFVDGCKTQFTVTKRNIRLSGASRYSTSLLSKSTIASAVTYREELVSLTRTKLTSIPAWRPEKWLSPLGVAVSDRPLKALALLRATMKK